MGFLSGVLGAVKDDDAVKTYDKHLDNRLEKVLKSLQSKIGSGRNGLAASVDAVKGWLNNYLLELGTRTSTVTGNLGRLNEDISNKISCFADVSDQKLETQLEEWKSTIISLDLDLKTIENTYINKLDRSIRNSIIHEMRVIHSTVSVLRQAATDVAFGEQIKKCDIELEIQRAHVVSRINNESERVRKSVEAQVNRIGNEINHMEMTKKWHINDINRTLKDSLASAGQIDGTYKSLLTWHFDEIKKVVNDAQNTLFEKKAALEALVATTQRYFEELKQHLGNYKQDKKGDDLNSKWMQLTTKISQEVSNLYCEQRTADKLNYIGMIEHGLQSFTKDFGTQAFETAILTKWVTEIVKDRYGKVYREIGNYVSERSAARIDRNNVESAIINNLPVYLKRYVTTAIQAVVGAASSSTLDAKLSLIASRLGEFAEKCQHELQTDETLIEAAASIEGEGGLNIINQGVSHRNHFLKQSIKHILYSLSVSAKNFASEFQSFLSTSNIGTNLRGAISTIQLIGQQFEESATSSFGKKIADALSGISQRIDDLDGMLKTNTSMLPAAVKALDSVIAEMDGIKNNDSSGKIEEQKERAGNVLLHMKTDIVDKLNGIVLAVQDADTGFSTAVQTIRSTLAEGYAIAAKSVSALTSSLLEQVKTSFATLTKDVQTLFATRHKSDLEALRKLIETQTLQIHNIIETDQNNGIKGLIRKMLDNFTYRLDDFSSWHSNGKTLKFTELAHFAAKSTEAFEHFFHHLKQQRELSSNFSKAEPSTTALFDLLDRVIRSQHYDNLVSNTYEDLQNALSKFPADTLPDAPKSVLAPLKAGLSNFTAQLGHAYVNRYSGKQFEGVLLGDKNVKPGESRKDPPEKELTPEGRNCAKVCLTIVEILGHDLEYLKEECNLNKEWNKKRICLKNAKGSHNDLGLCLKRFGYGVPSKEGKQDSELTSASNMNGNEIYAKLIIDTITHRESYNLISNLKKLTAWLATYYRVRHYSTLQSQTYPLSVYQMLNWLSGFPNNPAYNELTLNGFSALFDKPDEEAAEEKGDGVLVIDESDEGGRSLIPVKHEDPDALAAYPESITAAGLSDNLALVCSGAHDVLTSILGHGHSNGIYACEFNTNSLSLSYPADTNSLVCMLFDILKRIHHQLYILYHQCSYETDLGGWRDCWYGRDIGGSDWRCNRLQCPDQSADQIHNQMCDQKRNQSAGCGLKSPLQSYLEDGLQGYLPHQIKYEKGKVDCALKDHSGGPCKSPIGFPDISVTASHRYIGKHIHVALASLFGEKSSPLSQLCAQLNCLLPSAPKTLDDMFGFYLNFIGGWSRNQKSAFEQTVRDANFKRNNATLEISPVFESIEHKPAKPPGQKNSHITGDLYTLVKCRYNESSTVAHPCGPYLRPSCYYASGIFADKHNDKYLSWIVYLTETFHRLLKQLYEECNGNCGGERPKCRISKCVEKCGATTSPLSPESTHKASCNSIVHCKYMRPTFYKFGFVLRDCKSLSDQSSRRTCQDFCTALNHVINEKETVGAALAKLIYVTIPEYLLEIRKPFMLLTLALWLLSLFYLLCVMVGRLDLLHIKSHLRSPASHRIAAQSLLAAARVGRLSKIAYLQP